MGIRGACGFLVMVAGSDKAAVVTDRAVTVFEASTPGIQEAVSHAHPKPLGETYPAADSETDE
jgi:hypothetical protein